MMRRRNGRHWPAEGRPSVYAIRHRLRNELRPTGRFLCGAEIHEHKGEEYLVFNNVTIATPEPDTGDTKIGMLTIAMPSGAGGAQ
ncbi:hypothetical protein SEA_PHAYONCE_42 [Mycobacterium phage Phayonce]|uniref:Uncharacterized protein n=1 Tax=Mycobacterium phage Phayonce TaxID=1647302 RepID=A0A0F6SJL0_9CAUD|nr:hypothetical protein SEA_PHAYONCE_42 [Mycobacterium phage Phayonce]AKF14402.1 hypothetical protein SEA_PHAYONCE_42 [Mycobacterium phage Phayonce]